MSTMVLARVTLVCIYEGAHEIGSMHNQDTNSNNLLLFYYGVLVF